MNSCNIVKSTCVIIGLQLLMLYKSYLMQGITEDNEEEEVPNFSNSMEKEINVTEGATAILICRVEKLSKHTISWIRDKDTHVLTVGKYKYTGDERFEFNYVKEAAWEEYKLFINQTNTLDDGIYRCQINTQPVVAFLVKLNVIGIEDIRDSGSSTDYDSGNNNDKEMVKIVQGEEMLLTEGKLLNITCVVRIYTTDEEPYVIWLHNHQMISHENSRIGTCIFTYKKEMTILSNLMIFNTSIIDTGTYICHPVNLTFATIRITISPESDVTTATGRNVKLKESLFRILLLYWIYKYKECIENIVKGTRNIESSIKVY